MHQLNQQSQGIIGGLTSGKRITAIFYGKSQYQGIKQKFDQAAT